MNRLESIKKAIESGDGDILGYMTAVSGIGQRFDWNKFHDAMIEADFGKHMPSPDSATGTLRKALQIHEREVSKAYREYSKLKDKTGIPEVRKVFWRHLEGGRNAMITKFGLVDEVEDKVKDKSHLSHNHYATIMFVSMVNQDPEIHHLEHLEGSAKEVDPHILRVNQIFDEESTKAGKTKVYELFSKTLTSAGGFLTGFNEGLWWLPSSAEGSALLDRLASAIDGKFGYVNVLDIRNNERGKKTIHRSIEMNLDKRISNVLGKVGKFTESTRKSTIHDMVAELDEFKTEAKMISELLGLKQSEMMRRIEECNSILLAEISKR